MSVDEDDWDIPKDLLQEITFIAPENEDTTCVTCGAEFIDSEDLDIHVLQFHQGLSICQFCDTTYTDLDSYSLHVRDYHLEELQCCQHCRKVFTDRLSAQSHERRHFRKDGKVKCSQCNLFFDTKEVIAHEFINHNNDDDGVFLKCMTHLSALLRLKAETLLSTPNRTLTCFTCGFSSVDLTLYIKHLNVKKCSIAVCDQCNGLFKSKKSVMKHLMRKRKCFGISDYSNLDKCPICSDNVLKMLMAEHQKVCKAYSCGFCSRVFKTIDELSRHQIEEHPSGLDIITCQYCPKEFAGLTGRQQMKKHMDRAHRPHMHQYKYMCKKCDSIFKHPSKLFAHYFTKHKDFEPYTCRLCDKKFRIRKKFTIHIKMQHKGEGFVEFDDQYNVFFTEKPSDKPFIPKCVFPGYNPDDNDIDHSKNDTDLLETDIDNVPQQQKAATKKTRKRRPKIKEIVTLTSSDEEDAAPLLVLKKRAERKRFFKEVSKMSKKKNSALRCKEFTCKVCKKYCYTYHNYHNHMKLHSKNESIECVKCLETFANKKALTEHISKTHTTSKLIETLKTVLERKHGETQNVNTDNNISNVNDYIPNPSTAAQRFLKTIKKVTIEKATVPATIKECPNDLSAKKFLENFSADINNTKDARSNTVTVTGYLSPYCPPPTIKLHKFVPDPPTQTVKLKMPTKCQMSNDQNVQVTVKILQNAVPKQSMFERQMAKTYGEDAYGDNDNFQDDDNHYKSDSIPEVAQEVMLDGSEEPPRPINMPKHRIVIPKLPVGYKDIHIATLHPEKPYFKIIKVKDASKNIPIMIDTTFKTEPEEIVPQASSQVDEIIRLDNGTKLVTANPLSHLLGDRAVEDVMQPFKNKHYKYKPMISDYRCKLVEALQNLNKQPPRKGRKKKAE